MKKNKIRVIFGLLLCALVTPKVYASSATINVSTTSTVVGGSVSATLIISGDGNTLGQIEGTFTCGSLGNRDLNYVNSNNEQTKSKTYVISGKATTAGSYICSVSGLRVGVLEHPENGRVSVSATSKTIVVKSNTSNNNSSSNNSGSSKNTTTNGGTTADKKKYSSDNYLSSLSIDGYELDPKFDKNTLEYKLELDESIEKITVNAKANDSKATVTGTGEATLSSGENAIEVKVTAENGNEKIYKIIANVIDKNPIEVTIDNKKYTVVKKNNKLLDELDGFEKTELTINNQKVEGYKGKDNNITLVILKDSDGKFAYYIYDNGEYNLYKYIKYNDLNLLYKEMPNDSLDDNYKKYSFTYDGEMYTGYVNTENPEFCLFYAMNIGTGKEGIYQYDIKEKTIQRYNIKEVNELKEKVETYYKYLLCACGSIVLLLILWLVYSIAKRMKYKKNVRTLRKKNQILEHDMEYMSKSSFTPANNPPKKKSGRKKKNEEDEEDWDGFDPI